MKLDKLLVFALNEIAKANESAPQEDIVPEEDVSSDECDDCCLIQLIDILEEGFDIRIGDVFDSYCVEITDKGDRSYKYSFTSLSLSGAIKKAYNFAIDYDHNEHRKGEDDNA